MNVWLFDLDGVLVHPVGYHAALKATVNHLSRAMQLGDCAPDDEAIETFEACGITSEWDSSAICLATILFEHWRAHAGLDLPADFAAAVQAVRAFARPADWNALYRAWAQRIALGLSGAAARQPSEAALNLFVADAEQFARDGRVDGLKTLLEFLLRNTRNFAVSPTLRIFQTYTLGSARFAEHYGIAPMFDTPSLLRELDRPAISPENRARILKLRDAGIRPAIFTLRPCMPRQLDVNPADYPPEAEIALEMLRFHELPMIGYGHLFWLTQERGVEPDAYGKPSPVHALAVIARAIGGDERASLRAAIALVESERLESPLDQLRGVGIAIDLFEDSPSGIQGVLNAARLLERVGVNVTVHAWGVTESASKRAALQPLGAAVFPDVNDALEQRHRVESDGYRAGNRLKPT